MTDVNGITKCHLMNRDSTLRFFALAGRIGEVSELRWSISFAIQTTKGYNPFAQYP